MCVNEVIKVWCLMLFKEKNIIEQQEIPKNIMLGPRRDEVDPSACRGLKSNRSKQINQETSAQRSL